MALLLPHHLHLSLPIDKHRKPFRRHGFISAVNSSGSDSPPAETAAESTNPISSGKGFGQPSPESNQKKQKGGRRERGTVIRRNPVERPAFLDNKDGEVGKDQAQAETVFLLAWLALGAIILTQGLVLASSGFLPERWDNILVKYLYPSFTPTVGLFIAGTVAYGVLKYFQNENANMSK